MRDAAFLMAMLALLPLAVARPFVGVLLWCWISFMNPHRVLYGVAADLPWAALIFVTTVLGIVISGQRWRPQINTVTLLVAALIVCITVTSLTALGPPRAVWAKYDSVVKVLVGLLLTASLLTDRTRIHALVWIMVLSLAYFGVRGGVFAILTAGAHRVFGPESTIIADNNHLAAGLLITLPLMNYLRLQSARAAVRWGLVVAMGLTLLAAVASYSRGALLALAAATVVMWLRSRGKLTSGVLLAVCVAGAITFMPDRWVDRMRTLNTYQADASATDRLVMWRTAWALAVERPLVGAGFAGPYDRDVVDTVDPTSPARAVHSIWFEVIGEHGFPTFVIWVGLTVAAGILTLRLERRARGDPELAWAGDLARMAQVSIVAYVVGGTFLSLSYWDFYWTLLVVVGAAHTVATRAVPAAAETARRAGQPAGRAPAFARVTRA